MKCIRYLGVMSFVLLSACNPFGLISKKTRSLRVRPLPSPVASMAPSMSRSGAPQMSGSSLPQASSGRAPYRGHLASVPRVAPNGPQTFLVAGLEEVDRLARQSFLAETVLVQGDDRDFLGEVRPAVLLDQRLTYHRNIQIPNAYPVSPLIHSYHQVSSPIDFGAKFPAAFARNLPEPIRLALQAHPEIQRVEIFFTPQFNQNGYFTENDPALKAHFWATPDTEAHFGEFYDHHLPMAIFDSDYPVNAHWGVLPFYTPGFSLIHVWTHANTYSPPGLQAGSLRFQLDPEAEEVRPVTFWSVVLDLYSPQPRAAVTLHALFPDGDGTLRQAFNHEAQERAGMPVFADLVEAWNEIPALNNSPMIQKLRALIQI